LLREFRRARTLYDKAIKTQSELTALTFPSQICLVREYRTFVFHWLYVGVLKALKHLKIVIILAGDPTPNPHPGAIFSEVLNLEPEPFPFSVPVEIGDEMAVTTVRDVFVI